MTIIACNYHLHYGICTF